MAMSVDSKRGAVTPDMNVTPLVDVVLVLLIIFMVLAPVVSASFKVRLPPKPEDDKDRALQRVNDADKPLVLSVGPNGDCAVNGVALECDQLPKRLHLMFNARPDNVLYLDGADDAGYGEVLARVDLARAGGASPLVLLTQKLQ